MYCLKMRVKRATLLKLITALLNFFKLSDILETWFKTQETTENCIFFTFSIKQGAIWVYTVSLGDKAKQKLTGIYFTKMIKMNWTYPFSCWSQDYCLTSKQIMLLYFFLCLKKGKKVCKHARLRNKSGSTAD